MSAFTDPAEQYACDLATMREHLSQQRAVTRTESAGSVSFGSSIQGEFADAKPEPLPAALPNVEAFAPELLPSSLADRCADISERMQCAPDFPAIGSMVALGSVIGRAVGIRPKQRDDWLVVPNLWGCIVGRPSVLKSPALKDAMTPLGRLEAEAGEAYQQAKQAHDAAEIMAGLEKDEAKKRAKAALKKGNRDEAERILTTADDEPELTTQSNRPNGGVIFTWVAPA